VRYVQPTDEELFQRYNPELQKRSLERRYERQKEFDDFVTKLKEYSKSDKPSMCQPTLQIEEGIRLTLDKFGLCKLRLKRSRPGRLRLLKLSKWLRKSKPGKKPSGEKLGCRHNLGHLRLGAGNTAHQHEVDGVLRLVVSPAGCINTLQVTYIAGRWSFGLSKVIYGCSVDQSGKNSWVGLTTHVMLSFFHFYEPW